MNFIRKTLMENIMNIYVIMSLPRIAYLLPRLEMIALFLSIYILANIIDKDRIHISLFFSYIRVPFTRFI
jgi:hypothetical protein